MIIDCSNISSDVARLAVSVLNSELFGKDSFGYDVYPFGFDSAGHVVSSKEVYFSFPDKIMSEDCVSSMFRCVCKAIERSLAVRRKIV